MRKEVFKQLIRENQEHIPFTLFPRETELYLKTKQIHAIIGLRRSGKTHLFRQIANGLVEQGIPKERIIMIDFDDERLFKLKIEECQLLLEAYYELYPEQETQLFFFFDEVQNVDGWELFVKRLFEDKRYSLRITGSSSKLLSKEIATALRGRSIATTLYPLSFHELIKYRGITPTMKTPYSTDRFQIKRLLNQYLIWGGFFEVVDAHDDQERRKIIESYLNLIIYKDVVERYRVQNLNVLKEIIKYLSTNTAKKISIKHLVETLATEYSVGDATVRKYISYLVDIGFIHELKRFSYSLKGQNLISKYYVADPCFKTVGGFNFSEDSGRLAETVVLIELLRRGEEPFFFEERGECDFIVRRQNKIVAAYQVCIDPETAGAREEKGLIAAMRTCNLSEGTIITAETEKEEEIDGKKLRYVPLWRWLLEL